MQIVSIYCNALDRKALPFVSSQPESLRFAQKRIASCFE